MSQTHAIQMIRNANVEVRAVSTLNARNTRVRQAEIVINDKFVHRFPATSRISKHLEMMTPDLLASRLTGGSYLLVEVDGEYQLADFRDGAYNGFSHDDATIHKFNETIGVRPRAALMRHRRRHSEEDAGASVSLSVAWSKNELTVPGIATGGDFTSQLSFSWSPFVRTVNSSFDLVREICTNGMVGISPIITARVPVMNRWEEHLDIASRQIQNRTAAVVGERMKQMMVERATVAECQLLESHASSRLLTLELENEAQFNRLKSLTAAVSPAMNLNTVYRDDVFLNKNIAARLPAHLTRFDAWNVATELRSHTNASAQSSDHALDRFANGLVFDADISLNTSAKIASQPRASAFSSPERAFWGVM